MLPGKAQLGNLCLKDLVCQILEFNLLEAEIKFHNFTIFRSDAQRSVKQKERKKQELERQVFNGDIFKDGGFHVSMMSSGLDLAKSHLNHGKNQRH